MNHEFDEEATMAENSTVRRDWSLPWLLTLAIVPIACGPTEPDLPKLHVAAASDLQAALPILAIAFRHDHAIEIVPTFGASGELAEQIRQGAPFDVFLSANREFVEKLAREGHVTRDSVKPYARGSLVIAVNKTSAIKVRDLADLKKSEIHKVAIANTVTAPYGLAAKQALVKAGLWDELQPKLVTAGSVRQALQMVQTGNAEAALVGRSIADVPEVVIVALPSDVCEPIIQTLGVVGKSGHVQDAQTFVDFVMSDVGQGILFELGFRGVEDSSKKETPSSPVTGP